MSYAQERAESAGEGGMVEAVKEVGKESNFPGYQNPAGTTPGQRTGFTPEQLANVEAVRAWRRQGVHLLHKIGGTAPPPDGFGYDNRMGSANLTIALRHLEDAEYRAVRHITGGPKD